MPYISENRRFKLDSCIDNMVACLKNNLKATDEKPYPDAQSLNIDNDQLLDLSGDINYCITRIVNGVMGQTNYPKIAVVTGVLENIKQEFYRRLAAKYEDQKIISNGDISEYKNI